MTIEIRIEPLDGHPREAFSCRHDLVRHFFRKRAEEQHKLFQQRVFVACANGDNTPLGFYSLTLTTFESTMDETAHAKYREKQVPTIYIGAFGRDEKLTEPGFGDVLMEDAFKRCLTVRENVGVYAISLHAANERVAVHYEKYGFQRFEDGKHLTDKAGVVQPAMFILFADVVEAFKEL